MKQRRAKYQDWLEPENLEKLSNWAAHGCTMAEMANNMGVSRQSLTVWMNRFEPIANAIKTGRMLSVETIENYLFKSAVGDVYEETTVTNPDGSTITKKRKLPPSVSAQIFFLKNRAGYRDNPPDMPAQAEQINDDALSASLIERAKELDKHAK